MAEAKQGFSTVASSAIQSATQAATQAATDTATKAIGKVQREFEKKTGLSPSKQTQTQELDQDGNIATKVAELEGRVQTLEESVATITDELASHKGGQDPNTETTEQIMAINNNLFENVMTGGKKNNSKIIIENTLYTIDENSE